MFNVIFKIRTERIISIISSLLLFIFSNNSICQDSLAVTPERNILVGLEIGGKREVWKNPITNEKIINNTLRLAPRLGLGINNKLIIGGFYEYEFTNREEIPEIHGYGVFIQYYLTFLDKRLNRINKKARKKLRLYPHFEIIYNRNNTFYDKNALIVSKDKKDKFSTLSVGMGLDIKPFSVPFYINLGYRSLFFFDSPQKKILWVVPKLAVNLIL